MEKRVRSRYFVVSGGLGGTAGFILMEIVTLLSQGSGNRMGNILWMAIYFAVVLGIVLGVGVAHHQPAQALAEVREPPGAGDAHDRGEQALSRRT